MLLLTDRARHDWSCTIALLVCRLCEERGETVPHMLFKSREVATVRPARWVSKPLKKIILWRKGRGAMSTTANMCNVFETKFRRLLTSV
ncbi:hypothetical protein PoB_005132600 [Plakobranchus ocellatus]|uniref:Secreted protein n=1 Tax=Plakobranchus ocellatus TaxID=259542 RepID=A0AAV4BNI9_9GAST|nr:hypothetical protein PoB_005132600 [Plakobranchus ocellatus]